MDVDPISQNRQVLHLRLELDLRRAVVEFAVRTRRTQNSAAAHLLERGLGAEAVDDRRRGRVHIPAGDGT